jgi:hypothetical protein
MVPVNAVSSTAGTIAGETVSEMPYLASAMSRDTTTAGSPASRQTVYQAIAAAVCGAGSDRTKS